MNILLHWFLTIKVMIKSMNYSASNESYKQLPPKERLERLFREHDASDILITSSFGTTSAVLLHILSQVKPDHPVHFINTNYLFEETIDYKNKLSKKLGLNVVDVETSANKHRFTKENRTYQYHHDLCCFINKVQPLNEVKAKHKVWVSGLLSHQNANRENLNIFEPRKEILKFHPILDMTKNEVELYHYIYDLPEHQLLNQGYSSLGCTHCTKKGTGREGRWVGVQKTECGLHV